MTAATIPDGGLQDDPAAHRDGRTILVVGVDGSPPSWDAFAWAAGEARRSCGRMIAVFATPLINLEVAMGVAAPIDYGAVEQASDEVTDELAAEVGKRAGELGVQASFAREYGDAVQALTRIAEAARADLIVVGRSKKMLHHLAGAVGRRLVLNSHSPVIVVVP